jgi:hypothetical protein
VGLTLYLGGGYLARGLGDDLLTRLGPHTTGKGCVYVKDFGALDQRTLAELAADLMRRYDGQVVAG